MCVGRTWGPDRLCYRVWIAKPAAVRSLKDTDLIMLELKNITGGYQKNVDVLKGVNLQIDKGETVAIIGQNGAGKSTLAKAVVHLLPYLFGEIRFCGDLIKKESSLQIFEKGIGYFLQGGSAFPHLSVEENLVMAGHKMRKNNFEKRFSEIKKYFELFDSRKKNIFNLQASLLSGGERHQLALAMVLINHPKLLILDEPSAGLSEKNIKIIYSTLKKIREEEKVSIMLIEQNVEAAIHFSHRVLVLKNGIISKTLYSQNGQTLENISDYYFD